VNEKRTTALAVTITAAVLGVSAAFAQNVNAIIEDATTVMGVDTLDSVLYYGVLSHRHFDHTGGIASVVAEDTTIVTHEGNVEFFERALSAPRPLALEAIARSGRRPIVEGMGDMRVFTDGDQTVEIHRIQGLPHANGMLIAYLPEHDIVAYADMFNFPPTDDPVPDPPVVSSVIFVENLERLGLNWDTLITVHPPNPDRPVTHADVLRSLRFSVPVEYRI
jgi:glyoxylase-like metal-dependent hydrolase (beta-lactamase superfamily II)